MIRVRPMLEGDLPAVLAIAAATPTAPHWPEFEWKRLLAACRSEPDRRAAWVAGEPGAEVRGFAVAVCVADMVELESVVTAPPHRRQGVGVELLQAAVTWAGAAGARKLLLEVRASNHPALSLYEQFGFARDGTRPRYYRNPDEDAVLLSLVLEPAAQIGNGAKSSVLESPMKKRGSPL